MLRLNCDVVARDYPAPFVFERWAPIPTRKSAAIRCAVHQLTKRGWGGWRLHHPSRFEADCRSHLLSVKEPNHANYENRIRSWERCLPSSRCLRSWHSCLQSFDPAATIAQGLRHVAAVSGWLRGLWICDSGFCAVANEPNRSRALRRKKTAAAPECFVVCAEYIGPR